MTKLGKIFTAIMMLMSVMFFVVAVMANLTYVDYAPILNNPDTGLKSVGQRLQTRVGELNEQIQQQKEAIELELSSRRAALAALQVQMEEMNFAVRTAERALEAKEAEINQLAATEKASQEDLSAAGQQADQARQQMNQARDQRDAVFVQYRDAYGEWLRLQGDHRTLQAQYQQLTGQNTTEPVSPSDVR